MHAFFAQAQGSITQARYFAECCWAPLPKVLRHVRTRRGLERKANADHLIAFFAGLLAARKRPTP